VVLSTAIYCSPKSRITQDLWVFFLVFYTYRIFGLYPFSNIAFYSHNGYIVVTLGSCARIAVAIMEQQRINAYNVFILFFVGLGSVSYGCAASVIGITLGGPPISEQKYQRSVNLGP